MHYLTECLIIKNENQYLLEHLIKNAQAGIEHFYIYDNYSDVPVENFLKENKPDLLKLCTIELFKSTNNTQFSCYDKFLNDHRDDTKWCAFIDTDEIFEGNLTKLCKDNEDYLSLRIHQIMHGSNGHAYADFSKTMTERFQDHVLIKQCMVKCVSQVKYIYRQVNHHTYFTLNGFPLSRWCKNIPWNEECQLHHYFYRSFEEWLQKIKRGNVLSKLGNKVARFFDENSIPDEDRDALLEKYELKLTDSMLYAK